MDDEPHARNPPMPGLSAAGASPILARLDFSDSQEQDMGKKKAKATPKASSRKASEPLPLPAGTQPNAITIRGSARWKDWLDRFARRLRSKPTLIIDQALTRFAEHEGFERPPERMDS